MPVVAVAPEREREPVGVADTEAVGTADQLEAGVAAQVEVAAPEPAVESEAACTAPSSDFLEQNPEPTPEDREAYSGEVHPERTAGVVRRELVPRVGAVLTAALEHRVPAAVVSLVAVREAARIPVSVAVESFP